MKVTSGMVLPVITREAVIEDAPLMDYSYGSRKWRPDFIHVKYTLDETAGDPRWAVQLSTDIEISGSSVKKDGSDGLNVHSERARRDYSTGALFDEWKWLEPVIDALRPSQISLDVSVAALCDWDPEGVQG